ncbi:Hypothetical protein NTJ_05263 [Nesidiocoris tenuis]|uniref:Uncharacterized protein n=1 Tax=Nesidiocoris tenuis TaxID=355587 RepID=A0ABN7AJN2_9HEMI|nr:Hypothetical protein NTJ_05263 [Nesidiocoris tenuis]
MVIRTAIFPCRISSDAIYVESNCWKIRYQIERSRGRENVRGALLESMDGDLLISRSEAIGGSSGRKAALYARRLQFRKGGGSIDLYRLDGPFLED